MSRNRYANAGPAQGYDHWLTTTHEDEAEAAQASASRAAGIAERAIDRLECPDGHAASPPYQTFGDIRRPDGSLPPYQRSTHAEDYIA